MLCVTQLTVGRFEKSAQIVSDGLPAGERPAQIFGTQGACDDSERGRHKMFLCGKGQMLNYTDEVSAPAAAFVAAIEEYLEAVCACEDPFVLAELLGAIDTAVDTALIAHRRTNPSVTL